MAIRRSLKARLGAVVLALTLVPAVASPPASAQPRGRTAPAGSTAAGPTTAGSTAAGPTTAGSTAAGPTAEPVLTMSGRASCDALTGQWQVSWILWAWSAGIAAGSARDEVNDRPYQLSVTSPVLPSYGVVFSGVLLPGTATVAAITVTLTGPEGASPVSRRLPLPGVCERQAAPPCVAVDQATYRHTFDPATGVATVEYVGAPPCGDPEISYVTHLVQPDGSAKAFTTTAAVIGSWFGFFQSKAAVYADPAPCAYRRHLYFGRSWIAPTEGAVLGSAEAPGNRSSGPFAENSGGSGTCIAPTTTFASTRLRTGPRSWVPAIRITVSNAAGAVLPAAFIVSYYDHAEFWVHEAYQAAPGETVTVFVNAEIAEVPLHVDVVFPLGYGPTRPGGSYWWQAPPLPRRRG